jgi:UDP:flavonoid glycosyltransferase YjiC (YdhE family)
MTRRLATIRSTAASASTTGASNRATATTSSNDNGRAPTMTAEGAVPAGTGPVCVCVMPSIAAPTGGVAATRIPDSVSYARRAPAKLAAVRIVITTAGSRGDVAPYTGLAHRLNDAGHTAVIATHEPFRALVEAHGIEFAGLAADPREILGTEQGRRWQAAAQGLTSAVRMVGLMRPYAREMAEKTLAATEGADLILCSTLTAPNYHIAQGRGIPSIGVFLQPLERTREFSSVLTGGVRSYGSWGNRWSAAASEALLAVPFMGEVNQARTGMGLPAISYRQLRRDLAEQRWPVLHGFSRHLVPRPADWRPGLEVVGYWWPAPDPTWTPSADLVDFLAAGDPPVLLGFGSMAAGTGDAKRLAEVAVTALRDVGVRGILQAGWSGLAARSDGRGDILSIGEAPHDWLLSRVAAVVHHGGAGTVAAAVHHGVPAVPVPVLADQPFWSERAHRAGAAAEPIPFTRLTADRLAFALRQVLYVPSYRAKAGALAAKVAEEDGAGAVVEAVARL